MTPDTFPDLFFGYAVIWALFGMYLFSLRREQSKLKEKFEQLQKK